MVKLHHIEFSYLDGGQVHARCADCGWQATKPTPPSHTYLGVRGAQQWLRRELDQYPCSLASCRVVIVGGGQPMAEYGPHS